ncbi:MAG: 4Fe-4S binding protein [Anaerolineae bacterium]|nr:4Fe-4S binding protein [Anaerolineae bacterium]
MYGLGILRGLGITLRHFVETYVEDIRAGLKHYGADEVFSMRQGAQAKGLFTVEYPEEKIAVPERFRYIPFLVVNDEDHPDAPGEPWCTSCGICAKVCPPQCIWIVRGSDPETGRPVPQPEAFTIDIDICMNCGYCAEYCPFDAIKMDHDYEIASYDRTTAHLYNFDKLARPLSYWQRIAPTRAEAERLEREAKEAAKAARAKGKQQGLDIVR